MKLSVWAAIENIQISSHLVSTLSVNTFCKIAFQLNISTVLHCPLVLIGAFVRETFNQKSGR